MVIQLIAYGPGRARWRLRLYGSHAGSRTPHVRDPLPAAPDRALAQAAIKAVSEWRFTPMPRNAKPIHVATQLTIHFEFKG